METKRREMRRIDIAEHLGRRELVRRMRCSCDALIKRDYKAAAQGEQQNAARCAFCVASSQIRIEGCSVLGARSPHSFHSNHCQQRTLRHGEMRAKNARTSQARSGARMHSTEMRPTPHFLTTKSSRCACGASKELLQLYGATTASKEARTRADRAACPTSGPRQIVARGTVGKHFSLWRSSSQVTITGTSFIAKKGTNGAPEH